MRAVFKGLSKAIFGIILFHFVFGLNSSHVQAGEGQIEISRENSIKMKLVQQLSDQISRHRTMDLDAIKQDLHAQISKNRETARINGLLSTQAMNNFDEASKAVDTLQDKDQVVRLEVNALKGTVSAGNYMFSLWKSTLGSSQRGTSYAFIAGSVATLGVLPLVIILIDLVALPVTAIASAVTGF